MVRRKEIEQNFETLTKLIGKKRTRWVYNPKTKKNTVKIGSWGIDYNPTYGGYNIEEVMNKGGGVDLPFGERRRKPQQFNSELRAMIRALELKKRRKY